MMEPKQLRYCLSSTMSCERMNPKYLAEVLVHCLCSVEGHGFPIHLAWHLQVHYQTQLLVHQDDSSPLSVGIESSLDGVRFFNRLNMLESHDLWVLSSDPAAPNGASASSVLRVCHLRN